MHGSRDREREGDGRPAAASLSSSADGASFNMYESGEFDPSRMTVSDHGTLHAINVGGCRRLCTHSPPPSCAI